MTQKNRYICHRKEEQYMEKNNKVIATIDISRPSGRKIVHELQNKRAVKLEYPLPEGKTYTLEELYERGLDKLSEHYGVDMRQLKSEL